MCCHPLDGRFLHHATNLYVKDGLTTNGIESVWALMKRRYKLGLSLLEQKVFAKILE